MWIIIFFRKKLGLDEILQKCPSARNYAKEMFYEVYGSLGRKERRRITWIKFRDDQKDLVEMVEKFILETRGGSLYEPAKDLETGSYSFDEYTNQKYVLIKNFEKKNEDYELEETRIITPLIDLFKSSNKVDYMSKDGEKLSRYIYADELIFLSKNNPEDFFKMSIRVSVKFYDENPLDFISDNS